MSDSDPITSRWQSTFSDPVVELAYREEMLFAQRRLFLLGAGAVTAAALAFVVIIPTLVADGGGIRASSPLGATTIILRLVALAGVWKARSPRALDTWELAWASILVADSFWGALGRPSDYILHATFDIVAVLLLYLIVAARMPLRALPPIVLTAGEAYLLLVVRDLPSSLVLTLLLLFLVVNGIGAGVSGQLQSVTRQQFAALRREAALSDSLGSAERQIRTLSGLIPICAQCKKIKNDDGEWLPVEVYVRDRTEAEFSHGLCE